MIGGMRGRGAVSRRGWAGCRRSVGRVVGEGVVSEGRGAARVARRRCGSRSACLCRLTTATGRRCGPCRSPDSSDELASWPGLSPTEGAPARERLFRTPRERLNRGTATNEELPGTTRGTPSPALRLRPARRSGRTRRRRGGPVGLIIPVVGVPSAPVESAPCRLSPPRMKPFRRP